MVRLLCHPSIVILPKLKKISAYRYIASGRGARAGVNRYVLVEEGTVNDIKALRVD